jgi:hypothetical protein
LGRHPLQRLGRPRVTAFVDFHEQSPHCVDRVAGVLEELLFGTFDIKFQKIDGVKFISSHQVPNGDTLHADVFAVARGFCVTRDYTRSPVAFRSER